MEKEFNLRELTKRGCIRQKDKDFSDDGNRFKMLSYKNLEISYLKDGGDYFLSIRIPYSGENYIYDDYQDKEWYKNCDKYNYCQSIDPDDVIRICEEAIKGIEELESQPREEIDTTKMEERKQEEIAIAQKALEDFRNSNIIYEIKSEYQVKWLLDYYHSLESDIKSLQNMDFNKMEYNNLKYKRNFFNKYGYIEIKSAEEDFHISQLYKAINKEED